MKKGIIVLISLLFLGIYTAKAQATEEDKKNNKNDQEALDESMKTPKSKEQIKHEKELKKAKGKKEKNDKITRRRAAKISAKRLNKTNSGTSKKKKKYVKTHGGK